MNRFQTREMGQTFFQAVVEYSTNLIVALNRKMELTYASPSMEAYGYPVEDLMGRSIEDFIHPDDWPRIKALVTKCLTHPSIPISAGDLRAQHQDGSWLWFQGQYTFFEDLDGEEMIVFVGNDVTKRKKAEEQKAQLQAAVEQSLEGFAVADMDGTIIFANTAWAHMHGYEVEDLMGRNLGIFHSPEQMKIDVLPFIRRTLSAGSCMGEVGHVRKNGTRFPAWHSGAVLRDADGKPSAIMAVIHDITARKNAEIELKKREIMYRTLVEQSLQGVAIISSDPIKIIYCNPALEEILECSAEELCSQSDKELERWMHPNDFHQAVGRFLDRLAGKEVDPHNIFRIIKMDGTVTWLETVSQLITHEGKPATLSMCRDITDRRRLEENLRHTRKMEAIGTLAGGIAHNLNNILYPIMGYTEMAADDIPSDSQAGKNLQEVLVAINRAKDLVAQILAFSHKSTNERVLTELGPIVHEVVRLMRGTLPATIKVTQDVTSEAPAVIADPSLAHQALLNLCTNAFHAMRDTGGELEVALNEVWLTPGEVPDFNLPPGRYARISVRDTGVGIDPRILDRIFEPYFTTREVGEGTGMGLSEAHAFARNCGGDIRVTSYPGQGSCFEIYLPAKEQKPAPGFHAPPKSKGDETILLAENDLQIRKMNTQVLERLGYSVHSVGNGKEALEALDKEPGKFDLVITELHMPIMSGGQLARAARALQPEIQVILCTGFAEALTKEQALAMEVVAVVKKPMRKKDVAKVIRDVLDSRHPD